MHILTDLALYRPEDEDEWEDRRDAIEEVAELLDTLECLRDIETRGFANWVAEWGQRYNDLGAADTAARESVYLAAEQYLSLLELVREASYISGALNADLKQAAENVKGYFGITD